MMWTRAELKERAKEVLRGSYWSAFLVCLVLGIAVGGRSTGGSTNYSNIQNGDVDPAVIIGILVMVGVIIVLGMAFRIFVGFALEVGCRKYFIDASEGEVSLGTMGYGFKNGAYLKITKTMFMKGLYTFLWTLLLIIPGIIKSYAYIMVPYILADNPNLETARAIEISERMTNGEKFNIFVLGLSFLGWYLLGLLACCIGVLFVTPYVETTNAELYLLFRKNAIEQGICTSEELNLTTVEMITEN